MNYKQKLGYTFLGAGIMAVGIIIGQLVISDIEAQNNGVFNKITCRELVVVDENGNEVIVLESREAGNIVKVYDKTRKAHIILDSTGLSKPKLITAAPGVIRLEPGKKITFKRKRNEINPDRIAEDPSFSDYIQALEAGNSDLMNKLKQQATELRKGLKFPRDTFAVDRKRDIVIGHRSDGSGVLIKRGVISSIVGSDMAAGWFTYEKRGDLRVLTHYNPK